MTGNNFIIFLIFGSALCFSGCKTSKRTQQQAQVDSKYEAFKKTFEEEMAKLELMSDSTLKKNDWLDLESEFKVYFRDQQDKSSLLRIQCILPFWFSEPFKESKDTMYMIGISDPGYEDSIALKQAVSRAIALNALSMGDSVTYMHDIFSKENLNKVPIQKDNTECTFIAFISDFNENARIIKSEKLASKEIIVLMGFPVKKRHDSNEFKTRIKLAYSDENGVSENETNYELKKINFETQTQHKNAAIVDGSMIRNIKGTANGKGYYSPNNLCIYDHYRILYKIPKTNSKSPISDFQETELKLTLWVAYLEQILKNLTRMVDSVANNNRKHGATDSIVMQDIKAHSTALTRNSFAIRLPWKMTHIIIDKNKMIVDIKKVR